MKLRLKRLLKITRSFKCGLTTSRLAFPLRVTLLLLSLPLLTQCDLGGQWLPAPVAHEPLTLQNIQVETPAAIAPEFQLATPEAIAPEPEPAVLTGDETLRESASSPTSLSGQATATSTMTRTSTVTVTSTHTPTATASISPTALVTPATVWPTWTSLPTKTYTPSPMPTSTNTSAPPTQPPPVPTATASNTADPGGDPPVDPSPTHTTVPSDTPAPTDTPDSSGCNPAGNSSYEATLIGLINDARAAQGLHALSAQSQLTAAARVHSNDMACNDFISHTGSDGSSPADRVTDQGYSYSWVGENIFAGSSSPQTAFEWWMNSEPHRNNILHSNYTEIGLGYSYLDGSRYRSHYTAVFARPR